MTVPAPDTWFPPPPLGDPGTEAALVAGGTLPQVHCPVCGHRGPVGGFTANLRESGHCPGCGAWTRVRQLAVVLLAAASSLVGRRLGSIDELATVEGLSVYNTEARGPLHDRLSRSPAYVASEYFGPELSSGEPGPGGTLHQDLQRLSFATGSFDLVVSTDVLEHVPDPYRAHDEIRRVLRPGGHHVFTVPYEEGALLDDVRATLAADGSVVLLAEPLYHGDPVRPQEGALVYTIFGLEMVVRLARLGMETAVHRLWDPARGLVGPGAVFDSVRRE